MADQVQCPNCGGRKVNVEKKEAIKETKEKRSSFGKALFYVIGVLIAWAIISKLCSSILAKFAIGISWIPWILSGLLSLVIILNTIPSAASMSRKIGTRYHYHCQLCGYRWKWKTGVLLPTVTIRPDLIARGEQRLEEEYRKVQEDVLDLYFSTQQGKK